MFEPRSATACRALHQLAYPESFDAADEVLFAPLGRTNVPKHERLDIDKVVTDLTNRGKPATRFDSVDAIVDHLRREAERGDVIALLSNGAFGGIHQKLVDALDGGTR